MEKYFEATGFSNGGTKIVGELDRARLTRLFRGTYRIYRAGIGVPHCTALRFFVSPDSPNPTLGVRIEFGGGRAVELPLEIGGKGIPNLWLRADFFGVAEIYFFVLPPGQIRGTGRGCSRIWLAVYTEPATVRPPNYDYAEKDPGPRPEIDACPAIELALENSHSGFDITKLFRQDDEAEGYHED